MIRLLTVIALAALGSACASHPGDRIPLQSADYGFVDEILVGEPGTPRQITGRLTFPETGEAPYPAMVLMHSAQGRDRQLWMYARRFNELGFATLALDSFTERGIQKIEDSQTEVTEASMIADIYAALRHLSADAAIDANRIGVFGISKGGAPTVYASLSRFAETLAPGGERFAFHIAYYPWCGLSLLEPETTGAPILIQSGDRDHITPPALCEALVADLESHTAGLRANVIVHENARHAFDHPMLTYIPAITTGYLTPVDCRLTEVRPGRFVEESRGVPVTGANLGDALEACSRKGFLAGGNPEAAEAAWQNTLAWLRENLPSGRPGRGGW